MKRSTMLKKANKILASVMTASMLVSTVVPGTMVYASEISAPDVETEDGFTDGTEGMQENPVTDESPEEDVAEFDDGSAAAATATGNTILVNDYYVLRNLIKYGDEVNPTIQLTGNITIPEDESEFKITKSLTIDLAGHTITGNGKNRIFYVDFEDSSDKTFSLISSTGNGTLQNGYSGTDGDNDFQKCGGGYLETEWKSCNSKC